MDPIKQCPTTTSPLPRMFATQSPVPIFTHFPSFFPKLGKIKKTKISLSPTPTRARRGPPTSAVPTPFSGALSMSHHRHPQPPPPPPPLFPPPLDDQYHKIQQSLQHQPRQLQKHGGPSPLYKQHSWSPDIYRDEAWIRRKGNSKNRRSKSVTDEDVDELKGCIELGFGFDSNSETDTDQRLSETLPALGLYYAVNKQYYNSVTSSKSSLLSISTTSSSSTTSESDTPSPLCSPHTLFGPREDPQTMKTRLRQWAQVVACSVRQGSS